MESLKDRVKEIEKEEIMNAMKECNWVMSRAARKLSITERMKFSAWVTFSILWMTFVYVPVAHWIWGGGFLAKLGALDFAGGTVVHINAGIAALMGALVLGKRREAALKPSNLTLVVTGAGLSVVWVVRVQCRFCIGSERSCRSSLYQYQYRNCYGCNIVDVY